MNKRVWQHKQKVIKGFTQKYNITELIYFESFDLVELAIEKEKQIKGYSRAKKEALINSFNPEWKHLHDGIKAVSP